jgi:Fe-S oxidoreductase
MLSQAQGYLRRILESLRPQIHAGVPVIGLEPSCVSVFRDEMTNLFPDDPDAKALRGQVRTLAEFLNDKETGFDPPATLRGRKALWHGHCHAKAVTNFNHERELLKKMGLDVEPIHSTCCGVAGSFGYEADKYDVSMQIGEHGLLPAVRDADEQTLIVADGFSCRSQIEHATERRALHVAQVIKLALDQRRLAGGRPERAFAEPKPWVPSRGAMAAGLLAAGLVAGVAVGRSLSRRNEGRHAS